MSCSVELSPGEEKRLVSGVSHHNVNRFCFINMHRSADNHFLVHSPQSPHCMSPVALLNVQNVPFSTALPVGRIYNSDVASL